MNMSDRECEGLIVKSREFLGEGKINDALHILEINERKFKKASRVVKFNYYNTIAYIFTIQGNLLRAVSVIKKSLKIAGSERDNIKRAECYYLFGFISHRRGDFGESNRMLRRAFRYLGDSEETALKEKIIEVSIMNSLFLGKPQDSRLVTSVIEPRSTFDIYVRAFQRFNLGMYKEALEDINVCKKEWRMYEDHIYLSKGYYLSALILYKIGRYNEAFEDINQSIERDIKSKDKIGLAKSYFLLGMIEKSRGRLSWARDAFSKAERLFGLINNKTAEHIARLAKEGLGR